MHYTTRLFPRKQLSRISTTQSQLPAEVTYCFEVLRCVNMHTVPQVTQRIARTLLSEIAKYSSSNDEASERCGNRHAVPVFLETGTYVPVLFIHRWKKSEVLKFTSQVFAFIPRVWVCLTYNMISLNALRTTVKSLNVTSPAEEKHRYVPRTRAWPNGSLIELYGTNPLLAERTGSSPPLSQAETNVRVPKHKLDMYWSWCCS